MVKIDWGLLSSRRNKISNIPICPENTHSLCRLNMSVKPRCAEGNLSLPPITTICHYRRSMQMIDRADLLWWQKHRDRSPGPTVVIMHGPDPAGKNPDVHLVFLLRFELYRFGLSWKPHNDIPKLPSINFICYSCECYMCLEDQTGPGLSTSTCVFRFQGKFTVLCSEICWAGKRAEHVLCHDILIANTKASWSPEINDGWLWFEKVHFMPAKRDRKTRVCSNPKGFRREHWKTF